MLDRAETGIAGLDRIIEGGLPEGRISILVGSPGTGKTGREVELEIVDVFVEPSRALDAGPSWPARYVVGTVEDHETVEVALGLSGSA